MSEADDWYRKLCEMADSEYLSVVIEDMKGRFEDQRERREAWHRHQMRCMWLLVVACSAASVSITCAVFRVMMSV